MSSNAIRENKILSKISKSTGIGDFLKLHVD